MKFLKNSWLLIVFGLASSFSGATELQCAGGIEPSFPNLNLDNPQVVVADGEKLMVGGPYSILRVDAQGKVDPSFSAQLQMPQQQGAARPEIFAMKKDPLGRWVIAGPFGSVNGIAREGIARLLPNGEVDQTFNPGEGVHAFFLGIKTIALQSDGKIIVAGNFTSIGGVSRASIARLNENGSVDQAFFPGTGPVGDIHALAIQSDGKILVGGNFEAFDGRPVPRICRLSPGGSLDSSFRFGAEMESVRGIHLLQGDKFYAYGGVGGEELEMRLSLARFFRDGALDNDFTPILSGLITSLAVQNDGKLLAGWFNVHRYLPSGVLDPSFHSVVAPIADGIPEISAITFDSGGRLYIAGGIWSVNNVPRFGLARLRIDSDPCLSVVGWETNRLELTERDGFLEFPLIRTGNLAERAEVEIGPEWEDPEKPLDLVSRRVVFEPGQARAVAQMRVQRNKQREATKDFVLVVKDSYLGSALVGGELVVLRVTVYDADSIGQPGSRIRSFSNLWQPPEINDLEAQSDGRILVAGDFTMEGDFPGRYMIRINADGSLDNSFNYSATTQAPSLVKRSGESIYAIMPLIGVIRINSSGTLDSKFAPNFTNAFLYALLALPDESVLVGGYFTKVNGIPRNGFAKISKDGVVNPGFPKGAGPQDGPNGPEYTGVSVIHRLNDDTYLVAGEFTRFSDKPRRNLVRLSSDGEALDGFELPARIQGEVYITSISNGADGFVIISGFYLNEEREGSALLLRYTDNGVLDNSFQPTGLGQHTPFAKPQRDGRIIIHRAGVREGEPWLVRLNRDGSWDRSFQVFDPEPYALMDLEVLADDNILIIGYGRLDGEFYGVALVNGGYGAALSKPRMDANEWLIPFTFPKGVPFIMEKSTNLQDWNEVKRGSTLTGEDVYRDVTPTAGKGFFRMREAR